MRSGRNASIAGVSGASFLTEKDIVKITCLFRDAGTTVWSGLIDFICSVSALLSTKVSPVVAATLTP